MYYRNNSRSMIKSTFNDHCYSKLVYFSQLTCFHVESKFYPQFYYYSFYQLLNFDFIHRLYSWHTCCSFDLMSIDNGLGAQPPLEQWKKVEHWNEDSSEKNPSGAMPVPDQARDDGSGIQNDLKLLKSRLRGNDKKQQFQTF